jgi:predicted nucleic acid-binding protein
MTNFGKTSRLYFDANPLIYAIEGDDSIAGPIGKLLDLLRGHPGVAVTSELTLAEVLPKAVVQRRRSYLNLLIWSGIFDLRPVTRDILIETAEYRRKARARDVALPKLPDPIHIVTAIQCQCHTILSSDLRMTLPDGFSVVPPDRDNLARLIKDLS